MGLTKNDISKVVCSACGREKPAMTRTEFVCSNCGNILYSNDAEFLTCNKCKGIMKKVTDAQRCICGNRKFVTRMDFTKLIENGG